MIRGLAVALGLLAAGSAGCSETTQSGDDERARAGLESLLVACAGGHPVAALERLTELTRLRFLDARSTDEGCSEVLGLPAGSYEEALVDELRVEGDQAVATVRSPPDSALVELQEVGRRWLVMGEASGP